VPGSGLIKKQAEDEGLDKIFTNAGFEWREAGCSMCLAMNADKLYLTPLPIKALKVSFMGASIVRDDIVLLLKYLKNDPQSHWQQQWQG
jgi:hypothetical protein